MHAETLMLSYGRRGSLSTVICMKNNDFMKRKHEAACGNKDRTMHESNK